jgi:type I restriction enzyme S subunit
MPRANWDVLTKYPVAVPPPTILAQFDNFMRDVVAQMQNLVFRNRNLHQTRDLLLPRLVSGEVDVSELEIAT